MRIELDSRYYQTLLQWISQGTLYGDPAASQVKKIEVCPAEVLMPKPGMSQQMQVIAHYADGCYPRCDTRGIIQQQHADGRRSDSGRPPEYIAEGRIGAAHSLRRPVCSCHGDGAGAGDPDFTGLSSRSTTTSTAHVDAKLQKVEILPSEIASDAEFLRRVSLDLIGIPPTPEEIRGFLADPAEQRLKRSRWIDKLMARPEFVDHWTVKWGDLFQNTRKFVGDKGVWEYRDWIRRSIADNKPYDQWVREAANG